MPSASGFSDGPHLTRALRRALPALPRRGRTPRPRSPSQTRNRREPSARRRSPGRTSRTLALVRSPPRLPCPSRTATRRPTMLSRYGVTEKARSAPPQDLPTHGNRKRHGTGTPQPPLPVGRAGRKSSNSLWIPWTRQRSARPHPPAPSPCRESRVKELEFTVDSVDTSPLSRQGEGLGVRSRQRESAPDVPTVMPTTAHRHATRLHPPFIGRPCAPPRVPPRRTDVRLDVHVPIAHRHVLIAHRHVLIAHRHAVTARTRPITPCSHVIVTRWHVLIARGHVIVTPWHAVVAVTARCGAPGRR